KFTSDFTLGSQVWASRALVSASPCRLLFALAHRAACTTSRGYVDAMRVCATNESGYSAIGATNCSISSGLNVLPLLWAARRTGHGQPRRTVSSQTRSCVGMCFIGLPFHLLDNCIHAAPIIVASPAWGCMVESNAPV